MADAVLLLWRHGLTEWNAEHRYQGCNADVPLNAQGLEQARLSAPGVAARRPEMIVRSPLTRVSQTSAEAEAILGLDSLVDERLKEIDVGSWVGLTQAEVRALDPDYAHARDSGLDYRHGVTGETAMEMATRVGEALREWASDGTVVLIVSHGWALQMGVGNLLGWDYEQSKALRVMGNCALSAIVRSAGRWRIDMWNTRV